MHYYFKHQISFEYPEDQNKDKIFTISTNTDKKLGAMDLEGLNLSGTNIRLLSSKREFTLKRHFTYKRASQEKYEY